MWWRRTPKPPKGKGEGFTFGWGSPPQPQGSSILTTPTTRYYLQAHRWDCRQGPAPTGSGGAWTSGRGCILHQPGCLVCRYTPAAWREEGGGEEGWLSLLREAVPVHPVGGRVAEPPQWGPVPCLPVGRFIVLGWHSTVKSKSSVGGMLGWLEAPGGQPGPSGLGWPAQDLGLPGSWVPAEGQPPSAMTNSGPNQMVAIPEGIRG